MKEAVVADFQFSQCWNLDAMENWTGMKQAEGGTDWTLEQERTANPVNEITGITNSVGSAWAQPAYDTAGNMTAIPWPNKSAQSWDTLTANDWSNLTADGWGALPVEALTNNSLITTWDAWNRLVKLVDTSTSDTVAEYSYDANNRRIRKKLYTNGTLHQTRHIYVSSQNQVLEERLDSSASAAMQNIWGLMYIDGLILRDRDSDGNGTLNERRYCLQDANWNTVALSDETGTITQRFCYQPYGTCE